MMLKVCRGASSMTEDFETTTAMAGEGVEGNRRSAVDGLMAGRNEVWVMVARPGDDPVDLLWSGCGDDAEAGPMICRAVLDGGVLLLGSADPEDDPLLSDLLRGEDCGSA
jgi:hypothetical protein